MLYKNLGNTGVKIPEIGIGTWEYHGGADVLRKGLDAGALFIDTAESYGSEPVVAEVIADRRQQLFLATKISPQNFRRADVFKAVDRSLGQLCTDYIDLYQLHKPNDSVPIEETLGAIEKVVDAGKVRFIGVSNFSLHQLQQAQRAVRKHPIVSNQVRYNLIDRTFAQDLLPYCQANQVTLIAYSPLARGFQHMRDCDAQGTLEKIAGSTGHSAVQIALNWCVSQQGVVAIPKGNSAEHMLENCGASGWRLSSEQINELDQTISSYRRSGIEQFLRRHTPQGCKKVIQFLMSFSPRSLRRRIH